MKKIKLFILKICLAVLRFIYFFIKLFPTKNKIVMISRQSNNISMDFQLIKDYYLKDHKDYKVVMLCKTLDNKIGYIFHMFRQMYHVATSRVVILDSYCIVVSVLKHKKSLKVIQIWHAVGSMKKFGYAMLDKEEGNDSDLARIMCMHKNYDYILISSKNFIKDYLEGFNCKEEQVLEIPLPRVDLLLDKNYVKQKQKELYKRIPVLKEKKNILYCSTFRKGNNLDNSHIERLTNCIDFNKYNLLYKPHPLNKIDTNDDRIIKDFSDTYEALMTADYVICDYSSIIYEIGLLNKPIYIYAYDWEEYKEKRELNFDMEHEIPTLFTKDPQEIINAIENDDFDFEAYKKFVDKNVHVCKKGSLYEISSLIDSLIKKSL